MNKDKGLFLGSPIGFWIALLFFILMFLLTYTSCIAQQFNIHSNLETGYEDRMVRLTENFTYNGENFYVYKYADFDNMLFAKIDISANYKFIYTYTSTKTLFKPLTISSYDPYNIEYVIGAGLKYKRFDLYYEHLCFHTINKQYFDDGYDRIALKIKLF